MSSEMGGRGLTERGHTAAAAAAPTVGAIATAAAAATVIITTTWKPPRHRMCKLPRFSFACGLEA